MTVFKSYFKIALFNKVTILIYVGIFFAFAIFIANLGTGETEFREIKPNVAIFNEDDSTLSNIFMNYLEENANIINIEKDMIDDALFFRQVDYIIFIDDDFSETKEIDTKGIPDSFREAYLEILINRFLNIVDTYESNGFTHLEIKEIIFDDLETNVLVNLESTSEPVSGKINAYFNFSNYIILSLNIFLVSLIVKTFREEPILKRNLISSTSVNKMNKLLLYGNFIVSFSIFAFVNLLALILFKNDFMNHMGIYLILNSFVFSISAMMLGFLVGNFVEGKEARNGVVNVVGLGSSFISGAFVPQAMLASSVLFISRFFPSYYFINNNDAITTMTNFTLENTTDLYLNMLFILGFGVLFYILNNIFSKKKI